jgi:hypothetical protein
MDEVATQDNIVSGCIRLYHCTQSFSVLRVFCGVISERINLEYTIAICMQRGSNGDVYMCIYVGHSLYYIL